MEILLPNTESILGLEHVRDEGGQMQSSIFAAVKCVFCVWASRSTGDAGPGMDYCERSCQAHIIAPDKSMMQIGSQSTQQSIQIRMKSLLLSRAGALH